MVEDIIKRQKICITCEAQFTAQMTKLFGRWPVRPSEFKQTKEQCPECKAAFKAKVRQQMSNAVLGWDSFDQVKAHFDANPPSKGDPLIIASSQYHQNEYLRVFVDNPSSGKQKRIITDRASTYGGASFYRSGKSTFHPKGQTRLLPDHLVMAKLFQRFGNPITLSDDALAAVIEGEDIDVFEQENSLSPISRRPSTA